MGHKMDSLFFLSLGWLWLFERVFGHYDSSRPSLHRIPTIEQRFMFRWRWLTASPRSDGGAMAASLGVLLFFN